MKQMVKGSSTLTAVSLGEMVMRFVRTKCIALFLGPSGTGFLAQLTIFFELLRVWGDLGSRRGVIKQIAEQRQTGRENNDRYREVIQTSYLLALCSSALTGFVVILFSPQISHWLYGNGSYSGYIIFLALLLPIASLSTVTASIVKGNLEYASFAKYTIAAYGAVMLVTPIFIYTMGAWGALVIQIFFFAFPLVGYLFFNLRSRFLFFSKRINFSLLKEQSAYGFVQIYQDSLTQLARVLITTWIVKEWGLVKMGLYQVIITFSTVYMAIPIQAMSGYAMPLMASAANAREVTRVINDSLRFLVFLLVPIIVFVMIWSESFVSLFFSHDFLSASVPLQIQLFGTLFLLLGFPLGVALQARGELKALAAVATLTPLLSVGFTWLFFDMGQLTGIAVAFGIANLVTLLVQYGMARHYYGMYLVPKNQKLLLLTGAWVLLAFMAGAVWKAAILRVLATLLMIPWFILSSKKHERDFLFSKLERWKQKSPMRHFLCSRP